MSNNNNTENLINALVEWAAPIIANGWDTPEVTMATLNADRRTYVAEIPPAARRDAIAPLTSAALAHAMESGSLDMGQVMAFTDAVGVLATGTVDALEKVRPARVALSAETIAMRKVYALVAALAELDDVPANIAGLVSDMLDVTGGSAWADAAAQPDRTEKVLAAVGRMGAEKATPSRSFVAHIAELVQTHGAISIADARRTPSSAIPDVATLEKSGVSIGGIDQRWFAIDRKGEPIAGVGISGTADDDWSTRMFIRA